jgi:hypothetical protein
MLDRTRSASHLDLIVAVGHTFRRSRMQIGMNSPGLSLPRGTPVLARISHRTNARLDGYSDRRVCGVVSILAGGAGRREECWNHCAAGAAKNWSPWALG